ncbi:MAG: phosphoribosylanthranilate isomerase [Acidobacteriota bacterium]
MSAARIKICGVTLADDAARVAAAGVDFVGLNFWPKSRRYLAPERAPIVAAAARGAGSPKLVGVFVDASIEDIQAVCAVVELDVIQLHGDESPDEVKQVSLAVYRPVWKALAVAGARDLEHLDVWPADALLLDAPAVRVRHARPDLATELAPGRAGAGARFDHGLARAARTRYPQRNFILAGGLDPTNVAAAVALVEPWAVDVASGVEAAPGIKDAAKLAAFVAAVRG